MRTWNNDRICDYAHDGHILYPNGDKYSGKVQQNPRISVFGKMNYNNGEKYEGQWKNHKFSGNGTFISKDGIKYRGKWLDGEKHGEFTVFKGENQCSVCIYTNNKLVKIYDSIDKNILI